MPNVKGKKFPYTKKGMLAAKKAINEDDARGFRKRKAKAKRIKGETVAGPMKKRPEKGRAKNPEDLGKFIKRQQKKKPY